LHHTSSQKNKFQLYQRNTSLKIKQNQQGENLGYGYIQFSSEEEAMNAMEKLNNYNIKGKQIWISKFAGRKNRSLADTANNRPIFIQQMPNYIQKENDAKSIFTKFGKVMYCQIINPNLGVVIYENLTESENCMKELNNKIIVEGDLPFRLTLTPTKEELDTFLKFKNETLKQRFQNCNLIIKNLPKDLTDLDLFKIFKEFGDISSAKVETEGKFIEKIVNGEVVDKEYAYESKGFGYVCYKKPEYAENAINNFNGKAIKHKEKEFKPSVEYFIYDKKEKIKN